VNVFDYWRNLDDKSGTAKALFIPSININKIHFEKKYPILNALFTKSIIIEIYKAEFALVIFIFHQQTHNGFFVKLSLSMLIAMYMQSNRKKTCLLIILDELIQLCLQVGICADLFLSLRTKCGMII